MLRQKTVSVFGAGDCDEADPAFAAAERLGAACARRGWRVVNGGYGGTMLASARGATQAGGHAIGVTCQFYQTTANPFVSEEIAEPTLHERLKTLIELGDAYVVLPGATGTLAELALAWELVNKRMIAERPVICLGDFWRPVVEHIAGAKRRDPRVPGLENATSRVGEIITFATDVDQALQILESTFRGSKPI